MQPVTLNPTRFKAHVIHPKQRAGLEAEPKVLNAFINDIVNATSKSIRSWHGAPGTIHRPDLEKALTQAGKTYIEQYPKNSSSSKLQNKGFSLLKPLKLPMLYKYDPLEVALVKSFNRLMKRFALHEGKLVQMREHVFSVGYSGIWKPNHAAFGAAHQAHIDTTVQEGLNRFLGVQHKAGQQHIVLTATGYPRKTDYLAWDIFERLNLARDLFSEQIKHSDAATPQSLKGRGYISPESVKHADKRMKEFFTPGNMGHKTFGKTFPKKP